MKLYAILNVDESIFTGPVTFESDDIACHGFKRTVLDPEGYFSFNPENYELCIVGEMDVNTGYIEPFIRTVMTGKECVESEVSN